KQPELKNSSQSEITDENSNVQPKLENSSQSETTDENSNVQPKLENSSQSETTDENSNTANTQQDSRVLWANDLQDHIFYYLLKMAEVQFGSFSQMGNDMELFHSLSAEPFASSSRIKEAKNLWEKQLNDL
ncbi:12614_t:CDS:2, partial [Dentiscutata heterogama]